MADKRKVKFPPEPELEQSDSGCRPLLLLALAAAGVGTIIAAVVEFLSK
jgi:hypothetical protein